MTIVIPFDGESLADFQKRHKDVLRALGYSVDMDIESLGWPKMDERSFRDSLGEDDDEDEDDCEDENGEEECRSEECEKDEKGRFANNNECAKGDGLGSVALPAAVEGKKRGVDVMMTHGKTTLQLDEEIRQNTRDDLKKNPLPEGQPPASTVDLWNRTFVRREPGKTKIAETFGPFTLDRTTQSGTFVSHSDVGQMLSARGEDAREKIPGTVGPTHIIDTTGNLTTEAFKYIVDAVTDEARHAYGTKDDDGNPSFNPGFYSHDLAEAMDKMAKIHPELATDRNSKFMFTILLAITSNGQSPELNLADADGLYRMYKQHGTVLTTADAKFSGTEKGEDGGDSGSPGGARNIQRSLALLQSMVDAFGVDRVRRLLDGKTTAKKMNAALRKLSDKTGNAEWRERTRSHQWLIDRFSSKAQKADLIDTGTQGGRGKFVNSMKEWDDEVVPAAAIFGPKIGSFYSNLNGRHDFLTMDRWLMRTIGRITGELISRSSPSAASKQAETIRKLLEKNTSKELLFGLGKGFTRAAIIRSAKIQEKTGVIEEDGALFHWACAAARDYGKTPRGRNEKISGKENLVKLDGYKKAFASKKITKKEFDEKVEKLHWYGSNGKSRHPTLASIIDDAHAAGNNSKKALIYEQQTPRGPQARRNIRNIFRAVCENVAAERGGRPPLDEPQAVLWQYEKNLWKLLGAKVVIDKNSLYSKGVDKLPVKGDNGYKNYRPELHKNAQDVFMKRSYDPLQDQFYDEDDPMHDRVHFGAEQESWDSDIEESEIDFNELFLELERLGIDESPETGHDAELPDEVRSLLPESLSHCRSALEVYATEEGRQWWNDAGICLRGMDLVFPEIQERVESRGSSDAWGQIDVEGMLDDYVFESRGVSSCDKDATGKFAAGNDCAKGDGSGNRPNVLPDLGDFLVPEDAKHASSAPETWDRSKLSDDPPFDGAERLSSLTVSDSKEVGSRLSGLGMDLEDVSGVAGAVRDGNSVSVGPAALFDHKGKDGVSVSSVRDLACVKDALRAESYVQNRGTRQHPEIVVSHESMQVSDEIKGDPQKRYAAAREFYQTMIGSIESAREAGVSQIVMHAAGSAAKTRAGGEMTTYKGFTIWPRMGFDCKIPFNLRQKLPESLAGSVTVLDLHKTREGTKWWRDNGVDVEMTFDVRDRSSEQSKVFDRFAAAMRHAARSANKNPSAEGDGWLSPEDEAAIDKVWEHFWKTGTDQEERSCEKDSDGQFATGNDCAGGDGVATATSPSSWKRSNEQKGWSENEKKPVPSLKDAKVVIVLSGKPLMKSLKGMGVTLDNFCKMAASTDPGSNVILSAGGVDSLSAQMGGEPGSKEPSDTVSAFCTRPVLGIQGGMVSGVSLQKQEDGELWLRYVLLGVSPEAKKQASVVVGRVLMKGVIDSISQAEKSGVTNIDMLAAGDDKDESFRGFRIWPRLGFDGVIPREKITPRWSLRAGFFEPYGSNIPKSILSPRAVKEKAAGMLTIQALYETRQGQHWWEENGSTMIMSLEPQDKKSPGWKVFEKLRDRIASRSEGTDDSLLAMIDAMWAESRAWCNTGDGNGQDNSCPPGDGSGSIRAGWGGEEQDYVNGGDRPGKTFDASQPRSRMTTWTPDNPLFKGAEKLGEIKIHDGAGLKEALASAGGGIRLSELLLASGATVEAQDRLSISPPVVSIQPAYKGYESGISVTWMIKDKNGGRPIVEVTRELRGDTLHCTGYFIRPDYQGMGIALESLSRSSASPVSRMTMSAERYDNQDPRLAMSGYCEWPKKGWDAPISDVLEALKIDRDRLPEEFQSCETLLDIYQKPGGMKWWTQNGRTIELSFDNTPGSRSRAVLAMAVASGKRKHLQESRADEEGEPLPQKFGNDCDSDPEVDREVWQKIWKNGFGDKKNTHESRAWCATGEGNGKDNSCSPTGEPGESTPSPVAVPPPPPPSVGGSGWGGNERDYYSHGGTQNWGPSKPLFSGAQNFQRIVIDDGPSLRDALESRPGGRLEVSDIVLASGAIVNAQKRLPISSPVITINAPGSNGEIEISWLAKGTETGLSFKGNAAQFADPGRIIHAVEAVREIKTDGSINMIAYYLHPDFQKHGIALESLSRTTSAPGVRKLQTSAARFDSPDPRYRMTGYVDWIHKGYNCSVDSMLMQLSKQKTWMPEHLRKCKTMWDIIKAPAADGAESGLDWWIKNGDTIDMTFDNSNPRSHSRMVLSDQIEKAARKISAAQKRNDSAQYRDDLTGCDCDYDPDVDGPVWERIVKENLYTYTDEEVEQLDKLMEGTDR